MIISVIHSTHIIFFSNIYITTTIIVYMGDGMLYNVFMCCKFCFVALGFFRSYIWSYYCFHV